ncbi:MAG: hypothetical protein LKI80_00095 [Sporolactobacillus sp.]|nr:hypothetical protein [Sporolactobacillus sp.]
MPVTILASWVITEISPRALYAISYLTILVTCVVLAILASMHPAHIIIWLTVTVFFVEIGL